MKAALDPSPAQEKPLASHAGGARFAYNAMPARVKAAFDAGERIDQSFYALRKQWNIDKDAPTVDDDGEPWWAENSKEAYSYGLESLAKGLPNWSKSRKGGRQERPQGRAPKVQDQEQDNTQVRVHGWRVWPERWRPESATPTKDR